MQELLLSVPTDLREEVRLSFLVPQRGAYHNEGGFMRSHLALVLTHLLGMAADEPTFHEAVPAEDREFFWRAALASREEAALYVALHDLHKRHCLTFVYQDGRKEAVSWEEWEAMLAAQPDGHLVLKGDERSLTHVLDALRVARISYYQERDGSVVNHGPSAAEALAARGDIPERIVRAIAAHELAFQCKPGVVNIGLIERHFADWSDEDITFVALVNLCDQLGSLGLNGQPDIGPALALLASYRAYRAYRDVEWEFTGETSLDQAKLERALAALKKAPDAFRHETAQQACERLRRECGRQSYNESSLREAFKQLIAEGKLDAALLEPLVQGIITDGAVPKELARQLGKLNAEIRFIMSGAQS